MVRKTRSDKKNTTCDHCERTLEAIRDPNQTTKLAPEALPIPSVLPNNEKNRHNQRKKQAPIPILSRDYITNEEAKRWKELGLGVEPLLPNDLDSCQTLFHDLEQYDEDAVRPPTKEELDKYEKMSEPEAGPEPRTQFFRKDNKFKNLINEEFSRLGEITDEQKRDLEFREQEELGTALKRRAIAVHRAKVTRSHPDNGSDIRKFLESRRKQFRDLLEKEFNKRRQFKFALCSLGKFFLDNKPGNENKKSSRSNWL
ncbi:hypothetical protein C2G38_2152537 [Gigaspora rosea]|uniref:Uncharacterized protein n=1 Tax=Gigaspora rosea TaxID=44941 RepID=A0A397WCA7_9GLOM|nr:hypothetical protein C2G38_2152537 [Gigaspora rosea]